MIPALWLAWTAVAADRPAPLPDPLPVATWTPPRATVHRLSNGLEVRIVSDPRFPVVDVRLVVETGAQHDPVGKEGLSAAAFDLADEGAGDRDAAALSRAVKSIGAELSSGSYGDWGQVRTETLARTLPQALDLWADVIRRPAMSADAMEAVAGRRVQRIAVQLKDASAVAERARARLTWGEGFTGRVPTEASVRSLTHDDAVKYWAEQVAPARAVVLVGGATTPAEILPLLEARLGDWGPAAGSAAGRPPELRPVEAEVIYVVDVPGAPQSAIRGFQPVGRRTDAGAVPLEVAIEAVGGAFGSRVNLNLREDKGWTYGARCGLEWTEGPGLLVCSTQVRADATSGAIAELRRELADASGARPLTDDEVRDFRSKLRLGWAGSHQTVGALLADETERWLRAWPEDWFAKYIPAIEKTDRAAADAALRNRLSPARTTWIVVGDLATQRAGLEALGLPVVELDRDGRPVGPRP